jgi:hypothetical protein
MHGKEDLSVYMLTGELRSVGGVKSEAWLTRTGSRNDSLVGPA